MRPKSIVASNSSNTQILCFFTRYFREISSLEQWSSNFFLMTLPALCFFIYELFTCVLPLASISDCITHLKLGLLLMIVDVNWFEIVFLVIVLQFPECVNQVMIIFNLNIFWWVSYIRSQKCQISHFLLISMYLYY